jgi:hypothetical protein
MFTVPAAGLVRVRRFLSIYIKDPFCLIADANGILYHMTVVEPGFLGKDFSSPIAAEDGTVVYCPGTKSRKGE